LASSIPERADFAVITVIEEELDAVRRILNLKECLTEKRNYYHGRVSSARGAESHFVVCAACRDKGNISASLLASDIVQRWKPAYLLVVGIAGGVKEREVRLGDVIVHKALEYYECKKHTGGEEIERSTTHEPPSPILLNIAERIRVSSGDWQAYVGIKKPDGTASQSRLLIGEILSGEKLLGPTSPILKELLTKHDKALAVEMESGGVARSLWENRPDHITEFIIIRGISDYCDESDEEQQRTRDTWRSFAASSAAAVALLTIKTTPKQDVRRTAYELYKKDFQEAIDRFTKPVTEFQLTCMIDGQSTGMGALAQRTMEARRLLLRGQAGGGKSVALSKLAKTLAGGEVVPVLLNLKTWKAQLDDELSRIEDSEKAFDLLLRVSIADLNVEMLGKLPDELPRFVMVDGLNEVYGETATKILNVLDEYIRLQVPRTCCVLVTDRLVPERTIGPRWKIVELGLIKNEEVEDRIDSKFGAGTYQNLSSSDKTILELPYFLDYAIASKSLLLGTKASAVGSFFKEQLGLKDEILDGIAKAAFEMYMRYHSLSFERDKFKEQVGSETFEKLLKDGVIVKSDDRFAHFDHQLKHDYLASRYLARNKDRWDIDSFDAVSFESNSFESLSMTLEQLVSSSGDEFLTLIYDWNWLATVTCMANAARSDDRRYSSSLEVAVLALIAEKLLDRVHRTSERARQVLNGFSENTIARGLKKITGLEQIVNIVNSASADQPWFSEWRAIFILTGTGQLDEEKIRTIIDANPILGWTASNVIKRYEMDEGGIRQLRAYYKSLESVHCKGMIRWRIVHALGAFDKSENVDLLFRALDNDEYKWVRYGAARSLVEIAAITENEILRLRVLKGISDRIENLSAFPKVLEEIGQAAFYKGAPNGWRGLVMPVLQKALSQQKGEGDREKWTRVIDDFESFCKESNL
jgi:nucleoside phosphorylase